MSHLHFIIKACYLKLSNAPYLNCAARQLGLFLRVDINIAWHDKNKLIKQQQSTPINESQSVGGLQTAPYTRDIILFPVLTRAIFQDCCHARPLTLLTGDCRHARRVAAAEGHVTGCSTRGDVAVRGQARWWRGQATPVLTFSTATVSGLLSWM